MTKTTYQTPQITSISIYAEEDIANGNLLVNSHETDQEQLGKETELDEDGVFSDFSSFNGERE